MATTQEILELVLKVSGEAEAKKLEALLAQNERRAAELAVQVDKLNDEYKQGGMDLLVYIDRMSTLEKAQNANQRAAQQLNDRFETAAIKAGNATNKMAGLGQSLLQAGRGIQDFQAAGLRGVLNNVEGLTQALGGTAGLAGSLTVLAVAFEVFKPQITAFWESLGGVQGRVAIDRVKELEKIIKELSEKPLLLRVEQIQLQEAEATLKRLKEGTDAWNAAQEQITKTQAESGKQVADALSESEQGAKALTNAMTDALIIQEEMRSVTMASAKADRERLTPELRRVQALLEESTDIDERNQLITEGGRLQALVTDATLREQDARGKIRADAIATIGAMKRGAERGDVEAQGRLAGALEGVGAGETAAAVRKAAPARVRARQETKDAAEMEAQEEFFYKELAEAQAKKADAAARKADAQGKKAETDAKKAKDAAMRQDMAGFFLNLGMGSPELAGPAKAVGAANQAKLAAEAEQRAVAGEIARRSGGMIRGENAMSAAKNAIGMVEQAGATAQDQVIVNASIEAAMMAEYQAMQRIRGQLAGQGARFNQMGNGFRQMAQPMDNNQQGALPWGGFP